MHVEVRFTFTADELLAYPPLRPNSEFHTRSAYCDSGGTIRECGCGWMFTVEKYERRLEDLKRAFDDAGGNQPSE